MTSGVFHQVSPSSIWVNRESRQRKEITDVEDLAASIHRVGLIHPPVIRRSGELVVGERRWTAIKSLGWTSMPVQYIEDLSEHELRAVELDENLRRKDISWHELCLGLHEYHQIRCGQEPDWSTEKSADALGISTDTFYRNYNVALELLNGNKQVIDAPRLSVARNIIKRKNERAAASEIATLLPKQEEVPSLQANFNEWARIYSGPKFNLIHCDFPYGINADQMDSGAAPEMEGYSDSLDIYNELLYTLCNHGGNFIDDSAHLIFWFALQFEDKPIYENTRLALGAAGWRLDGRLLIWHKSDGASILPDPSRGPRWTYETAFFGSRGDRKIVKATTNLVSLPTTKEYHMSEKPVPVLNHFFRMVCDEYTSILDPTCGSGNALIAARALSARRVYGLEYNAIFAARARENYLRSKSSPLP